MAKIDKLIESARPHLESSETIIATVMGTYEAKMLGKTTIRNGVFLATDRRLVFYAKKLTGYDMEVFPYSSISSMETGKDFLGERIAFFASGNKVSMKWINDGDITKFVQVVNQGMKGEGPTLIQDEMPAIADQEDGDNAVAANSATSSDKDVSASEQAKTSFWRKIPGYRTGTKWKMVVASIFYGFFALCIIAGVTGDGTEPPENPPAVEVSSTKPKPPAAPKEKTYPLEFNPQIKHACEENKITINADIDCPDGAIMQIMLMSGDLEEIYTDKPVVKNGSISSAFTLKSTEPKYYGGMVMFQFNAKELVQPDNVLKVYGKRGEKLKGENAQEAKFVDGSTGKNASVSFTAPYPSEKAVEQALVAKFNEAANEVVAASNGAILDIKRDSPGTYYMMVSNSSWYLSAENEKQYFAEEMLKAFTQVGKNLDGKDSVILAIFDESMNEVARSKVLGGMKIKR